MKDREDYVCVSFLPARILRVHGNKERGIRWKSHRKIIVSSSSTVSWECVCVCARAHAHTS